jgi:hypothetical protein
MSNPLKVTRIVDPVLSGIAQGIQNAALVGTSLMPFATTNKEGGVIPKFGVEHFRVFATNRAVRAASNRINPPTKDTVTIQLEEHDLEMAIDYREQAESDDDERINAAEMVQDGLNLGLEYQIAQLARNAANYADSNKINLSSAGDKFGSANSDPEGVIEDAKKAIADGVMMDPNTMIIPRDVLRKLKRHPKLRAILADDRSRLAQLNDMREIFEIENIVIASAQFLNASGVRVPVWGNDIVLAYVSPGTSAGEGQPARRSAARPSFGYTLRRRGMPMVDTYAEGGGKLEVVRSTDILKPYLLGPAAGYLIQNAI